MTSFKKASAETGDTVPVTTSDATVAVATNNTALAVPSRPKIGSVTGAIDRSDYKVPNIQIVHNTGELQNDFDPGSIVLNKEVVLSDGNESATPVKLTVLTFDKYFLERVPFEEGAPMPRIFRTKEALAAAGLHTDWVNDTPPPAIKAGTATIAIESDVEKPQFPFQFGDKFYALAEWKMHSQSAYSRAATLIITAADWNLKDGLHNGSWTLTTRKEKMGKNWVYVPVLKNGPRNAKELVTFFETLLG